MDHCLAVAASARRHIEDVCSLANAYSKSVLDVFTIQTRLQAFCCPSLSCLTHPLQKQRMDEAEREQAPMQQPRGETLLQNIETMQDYTLELIKKERHPDKVLVHNETVKKTIGRHFNTRCPIVLDVSYYFCRAKRS